MMERIINSVIALGALGFVCGTVLVWASRRFAIITDPKVEKILDILPGANCGACGFASCSDYAERAASGEAAVGLCVMGGEEVAEKMAKVLGASVVKKDRNVAFLRCNGGTRCIDKFQYDGVKRCMAATLVRGGEKACTYGCLGYGDCVKACPLGAITIGKDGLPAIDESICVGCGLCASACPKGILAIVGRDKKAHVLCSSHDRGKHVREVCEVGCIGCGICAKACPSKAITIKDFLATVDPELCIGCGICVEKCPRDAIKLKPRSGENH